MKRCACAALALCLLLAGCGPRETAETTPTPEPSPSSTPEATPTPTPAPTPTPQPTGPVLPDPETDPSGYVLACLDRVLEADEKLHMAFWQHPGSGPSSEHLSVAEFGATVRGLFEELDWELTQGPVYDEEAAQDAPFDQPGAYGVDLFRGVWNWDGSIHCALEDGVVRIAHDKEGSRYFTADGAEKLCEKLTDVVPSLYINLGRVRVPPQKDREATVKLYVETAMEKLKENGHITDYVLRVCEPVTFEAENWWEEKEEPAWETHPSIAYTIAYSLKPAHPELSCWQEDPDLVYWNSGVDEDGWVNVNWGVWEEEGEGDYYEFLDYDERDGRYGMG